MRELLLQSLEHELGGVLVYQTALECVRNPDLEREWRKYLDQTQHHVEVLTGACADLGLDPDEMTPGRKVVQHNGKSLVIAMKMALASADAAAAELVACECVVLAETKDHFDWQLVGECAKAASGEVASVLKRAYDDIEDEEDEHLYHTKGWCRELWLRALGLPAQLPPPEEKRDVRSAKEEAEVERSRKR